MFPSNLVLGRSLSPWNHVDTTWDAGAHCVHMDTVGAVVPPDGPPCGRSIAKQEEEDDLEVVKVIPEKAGLERFVAQDADVPVPPVVVEVEITPEEHISERTQIVDVPVILDRPGEQAFGIPADTVHRQGYCRHACCATATGSVTVAQPSDQARRVSADTVHRQGCCRACCDTATGPSATDVFEDCESPSGGAHRIPECIVGQFDDVPVPQILNEIVEVVKAVKNVPRERISEGFGVQIVDAPVSHSQPQILKEVVEVVKAVKNHPQERISGKIG